MQEKPYDWIRGYQVGGKSLIWARQTQRWSRFDFEGAAGTAEAGDVGWGTPAERGLFGRESRLCLPFGGKQRGVGVYSR